MAAQASRRRGFGGSHAAAALPPRGRRGYGRDVSPALRLSLFYATIFGLVGIHLPFWPVWLAGRGLDAAEIGLVTAAGQLVRAFATPVIGSMADRVEDRRSVMVALALSALAAGCAFYFANGFWPILAVTVALTISHGALGPLIENLTMLLATARGFSYGRVRSLGSTAFIGMAVGGGWMLQGRASEAVLLVVVLWLALTVAAVFLLPQPPPVPHGVPRGEALPLLRQPMFRWLLLAVTLIQSSHAVYYAFGTLEWRRLGVPDGVIGALWAMGVGGEVVFFVFAHRVLRRLSPLALLVLSGAGGVVRWTLMPVVTAWPLLMALQLLHICTFACCHLGMMTIFSRAVPITHSATAQGLAASTAMGLGMGAMMALSGLLYARFGADAYLVMAVVAALGIAAAAMVRRTWHGGELALRR
jgi:PPP family 3-phenylpropionic acid transporter